MDPITTVTAAVLNLVVQGSPYAILLVALYVVWGRYQKALDDIQKLNDVQAGSQTKLVNKLIDVVTTSEEIEEGE